MPNAERLQGTLDFIKAHPEKHNQLDWVISPAPDALTNCGTACCFAGWTCYLYGPEEGWEAPVDYSQIFTKPHPRYSDGTMMHEHASSLAKDLLDLDEEEANYLFSASNTVDELAVIVQGLIDGTFEAPSYDYDYGDQDEEYSEEEDVD